MTEGRGGRARVIALTVVAVLVVALAAAATTGWEPPLVEDLRVYRDAAQRVLDGLALYPPGSRYAVGQPLPFTYPPFAALALMPLALVPVGSAVAAWWLLSFGSLVLLVRRGFAALLAPLSAVGTWSASLLVASVAAVTLSPVFHVFGFGQVGLVLGALCLLDLDLGVRRSRWAGVLVGLATAVKLTPGAFVLTYAAAHRWRAVVTAGATLAVAWAVPAVLLHDDTRDWLSVAGDPDRIGPVSGAVNMTWHGLWLRLLGEGALTTVLWLSFSVATLAVATVRSSRFLVAGDAVTAATVVGLASVIASPVAWPHHAVWVVTLLGVLVGRGRSLRRWLAAAVVVAVFSRQGMAWLATPVDDPDLRGVGDWFWVNTAILVSALAIATLRPDPPPHASRDAETDAGQEADPARAA